MWDLNQLKSELKRNSRVKSWVLTQENIHRRERYFMTNGQASSGMVTDQDRDVHQQNIQVKLSVHLDQKPGRQGEITKKLFPSMPLGPQIESAIEAAAQTDHKAWDLPAEVPSKLPQLETTDRRMAEDLDRVVDEVSQKISGIVGKKRETRFNSAELFMSVHDREFHLSNGLQHRASQSRIYVEAAYSFAKKSATGEMESDEYLNTRWAVSLDDLPLEKIFDETSDRAAHSLGLEKPLTGKYPVIVDADVLATLFNTYLSQLSASSAYNELPFIAQGEEFIPSAGRDLLDITLDPTLAHGGDTAALSDQGVPQTPLKLVEKNRVVASLTDKQFADYLGKPAGTSRGNIVVAPGALSYAELTKLEPRVLEILQFSGLFADPYSGTFSSEIRLARLHDNVKGTVTYLKGGSLSGSIRENFKDVRISRERVKRAHFESNNMHGHGYFGPEYALLSDVSIVG
jgi:predicted Zn-dependent protease